MNSDLIFLTKGFEINIDLRKLNIHWQKSKTLKNIIIKKRTFRILLQLSVEIMWH